MEVEYLLELSFDDYENSPWTETQSPSSVEEAKAVVKRLNEESDNNFVHGTLYEVKEINLDL